MSSWRGEVQQGLGFYSSLSLILEHPCLSRKCQVVLV